MSLNVSVPGVSQSVIDTGGTASRPYYVFFQSVATSLQTLSDQIGDVTTTPTESPVSENANVVGKYSIYTRGILKTGIVSVLLIGDVETPGNTQYYGSDATGEKGWHAVSDALDSTANITLTVGTDGVTTFDLADLANSGTGAALVKLTRDAKGRISGTSAATTDDLTEGSTNLWFTNERAQDAVGAALVGTGNVPLSYNDTGKAISAALSAGVLASLSLADTSVQPGDNVSGLTNDAGYLTDAPSDGSLYGRKNGAWSVFSGAGSGDVVGPASAVDGDAVLFDGTTGKLIKDGGSFGSLVRAAVLTGLSTATSAVIAATDTVLGALGKLQAQISGKLTSASNLSDLASASAARSNLGLGTAAIVNTGNNGDGLVPLLSVSVGQTTLDMTGVTGRVTFSGTTAEADGDGKPVLNFSGKGGASVSGSSEQRVGVFSINTDGATANNRGGSFSVTLKQNNSNALTNRLNVSYQGHTTPGADNAQTLGASSARWSVVYAGTGSINTSDARDKTAVAPLSAAELAAAMALSREIGTYQWLESVQEKGADARQHAGLTVQRAIEVLQSHGLDPFRYGFICYDHWDEQTEVVASWPAKDALTDEDGTVVEPAVEAGSEVVRPYRPAGDRYSFRHDELLLFLARGIDARLAALEAADTN